MPKTKFARIAVAGPTVDGREINPEWLTEAADIYDPGLFTARIDAEHIMGYQPDGDFKAYGDVLSLKTETVTLSIDGKEENRLALYAELNANDELVKLNKKDQKVFTSCEFNPDFLGRGKAYLTGLAVTDKPASIGTQRLQFSQKQANVELSDAMETEITIAGSTGELPENQAGAFTAMRNFFENLNFGHHPSEPEPPKDDDNQDRNTSDVQFAQVGEAMSKMTDALESMATANAQQFASINDDLTRLKSDIEDTPAPNHKHRPKAAGNTFAAAEY